MAGWAAWGVKDNASPAGSLGMKLRVLSVIGTRPEALKMGPVLQALSARKEVESLICATGQHRALMRRALAPFELTPDYLLSFRRHGSTPAQLMAALLEPLQQLVQRVRPDWILGVGDTTSVLCAGIAAARHGVRFGHVEAGLRTDCLWDPFPEEFNRRLLTGLTHLHFAPTSLARENLRRENVPARRIVVTGNPIVDTLRQFSRRSAPAQLDVLWRRVGLSATADETPRLLVVTFHRRETLGRPIREICAALRELAAHYRGQLRILCLLHPNPAVRKPVRRALTGVRHIVLSRPVDYPVMLGVLRRAHIVLTDSGGLQEEAPALRVPVLVMRRRTERPEGVEAGAAALIGTSRAAVIKAVRRLLDQPATHRAMSLGFDGYGDGHAAPRIVDALLAAETAASRFNLPVSHGQAAR